MNFRWFNELELGVNPAAPTDGDLVWIWIARTQRMSAPMVLQQWNSEDCRAGIAKHRGEAFAAAQRYKGWRGVEQAAKIYLDPGDLVCRVWQPEAPTI